MDAIQRHVEVLISRYHEVAESELRAFVHRTGLPISECQMVQLPNGKLYPQWRHATDALAIANVDFDCEDGE